MANAGLRGVESLTIRTGFAALWLLFLAFPLQEVLTGDYSPTARYLSVAIIAVFAVVYVCTCTLMVSNPVEWWIPAPRAYLLPAALCGLAAALVGVIGVHGLGLVPFLIAALVFLTPVLVGVLAVGMVYLAAIIVPVVASVPIDLGTRIMIFLAGGLMVAGRYSQTRQEVALNARARQQQLEKQLAVARERERLARDMHDILGHSLTVMTVKTELAQRLVDIDPAAAKDELAQLHQMSRDALTEIRATVTGLRVADVEVELLSARTALDAAGIVAELPEHQPVINEEHRALFGWVLREAVTNVVRHSGATRCSVRLDANSIRIDDDGDGIRAAAFGNGLRGLSERVATYGGELSVGAADGSGTRVEVTV